NQIFVVDTAHGEREHVVTLRSIDLELVIAGAAVDRLCRGGASRGNNERVITVATLNGVVPQAQRQRIVAIAEEDRGIVVEAGQIDGVILVAHVNGYVPRTSCDGVRDPKSCQYRFQSRQGDEVTTCS